MAAKDMTVPEPLQGLGLSQEQLQQVHSYFILRQQIAHKQKTALLGLAMVLVSGFLVNSIASAPDMPFESGLQVALRWLGGAALVTCCVGIGVQQLLAHRLNAELPRIGLSPRAVQRIRKLARAIVLVVFLGKWAMK